MTGEDLMLWRRQRDRMTQAVLAKHLGVSRKTVNAWENGRNALPHDIARHLLEIDRGGAFQPPGAPKFVNLALGNVKRLDLFQQLQTSTRGKIWVKGDEHPERLLGPDARYPQWPVEILDSEAYRIMVELWRAGKWRPPMPRPALPPYDQPATKIIGDSTLTNGWGQFCDRKRDAIERRILEALNGGKS